MILVKFLNLSFILQNLVKDASFLLNSVPSPCSLHAWQNKQASKQAILTPLEYLQLYIWWNLDHYFQTKDFPNSNKIDRLLLINLIRLLTKNSKIGLGLRLGLRKKIKKFSTTIKKKITNPFIDLSKKP